MVFSPLSPLVSSSCPSLRQAKAVEEGEINVEGAYRLERAMVELAAGS